MKSPEGELDDAAVSGDVDVTATPEVSAKEPTELDALQVVTEVPETPTRGPISEDPRPVDSGTARPRADERSSEESRSGAVESPGIALGVEQRLDPASVQASQLGWSIATASIALVCAAIVLIVFAVAHRPVIATGIGLGGFALLFGLAAWTRRWPPLEHRRTTYRIDVDGVEIRRGVYWREVVNVRKSRVQHTDVTQGPLQRHFGLATLVIYTAGTQHAAIELAGLSHEAALVLRSHLVGDDAVSRSAVPRVEADGV